MSSKPKIITVVGATASGKTDLARRLAMEHNGEIVSADSRQVYRYLDLGTGKDGDLRANATGSSLISAYPELRYLDGDIPQWLTDFINPTETYTVAEYQKAAYGVIDDILQRGKTPILCGGTGLYITSVIEGYDFSVATERDPNNPRHSDGAQKTKKAPDWNVVECGIDLPREELHQRIDTRLLKRFDLGLVKEVEGLIHDRGATVERLRRFGLEYKFVADYLDGILKYDEMVSQLGSAIHRYARRQLTWFRNHGNVQWIAPNSDLPLL